MKFTLSRKGFVVIALPFAIQLILLSTYSHFLDKAEFLAAKEYRNKEVFGRINWLSAIVMAAASSSIAFAESGKQEYCQQFNKIKNDLSNEFRDLGLAMLECHGEEIADQNNKKSGRLRIIRDSDHEVLGILEPDETLTSFLTGASGHLLVKPLFGTEDQSGGSTSDSNISPQIKGQYQELDNARKWVLKLIAKLEPLLGQVSASGKKTVSEVLKDKELDEISRELHQARYQILKREREMAQVGTTDMRFNRLVLRQLTLLIVAFNVLMAAVLFVIFMRTIVGRLSILKDNARRLPRNEALNELVKGDDEIADVDQSFHQMAADLTKARQELEASEERVRTIINTMPLGVLTLSKDAGIEFVNPASTRILGLSEEELKGKRPDDFISDLKSAVAEIIQGRMENLLSKKLPAILKVESGERFLEVTFEEYPGGTTERVLAVIEDVTERQEMEKRKHEFIAMVTHDLRTPLTSIRMFHDMLGRSVCGELTPSGMQRLEIVDRSVTRLLTLINDILDFEKLQAGKQEVYLEEIEISEILHTAVESISNFAETSAVSLEVSGDKQVITADSERLVRVIINLVSNAIKFSEKGSTVKVNAKNEGDCVRIEVIDTGKGIPATHLQTIFEKYKQVDRSDHTVKKGTGLGLPICKAIVEQHGGTIGVDSEIGKGSTFWIRLPVSGPGSKETQT